MNVPTIFDASRLELFCRHVFERAGVPHEAAVMVAESLVQADLRGVDSHGVVRTQIYLERLEKGMVNPLANVEVVSRFGATALVDGNNQYGAVAGNHALRTSLDIARDLGAGIVGVKNSNHFGTCAYYALKAIQQGFALMVMSNASQTMPPTGGVRPFLGTNPLAVGVPTGDVPFILDMATSVVSRGKIIVAAQKGERIPLGWAVDKGGNPTTDAEAALEGSVLPLGGAKGYGISMFIDILSGVLTGAGFGKYVNNMYENWVDAQNVGHIFIAIDISRFISLEQFKSRMDQYIAEIKAEPRAEGIDEILVPGEIEQRLTESKRKTGITLPFKVAAELHAIGKKYEVDLDAAAL
ncbi:Ldh family oxidoreductase [Paenibacillus cremeus]|uniref:Ldh family oxidoreductase n=1 Tax=Paenibacillus cremeus TaxID=2163881 RepID=A0A559JFD9_9BACL|nr:Ldh family oxidoreductase [Paenibacillus cremeus]TVX98589.1 Ldh family oxidoreductase [Paenibacillus cremeus]